MNNGVSIDEYKEKTIGYYGGKFLPFHKGHLNMIIKASKEVDVLFVVISYDDEYEKLLCEKNDFKWINSRIRERWISEEVKDLKNVRVLTNYEVRKEKYINDEDIKICNEILLNKIGGKIDIAFSSEIEYEDYYKCYFPNTKHKVIDSERKEINISATNIRNKGIYESWEYLPNSVRKHYIKRVCICGIESTGKSTMIKKLASLYKTNYVTEYGRDFYESLGGCFDIMEYKDLIKIACGHNYLIEEGVKKANKILFVDTDNIYTQFFITEEFGKEDQAVDALIRSGIDEIDLYLYLEPTLDHELDGMRQPKTHQDKIRENEVLKNMYKSYGKDLKVVKDINDISNITKLIKNIIK